MRDDSTASRIDADGDGTEKFAFAGVIDESISNELTCVNRDASGGILCRAERRDAARDDGSGVFRGFDSRDARSADTGRSERAFPRCMCRGLRPARGCAEVDDELDVPAKNRVRPERVDPEYVQRNRELQTGGRSGKSSTREGDDRSYQRQIGSLQGLVLLAPEQGTRDTRILGVTLSESAASVFPQLHGTRDGMCDRMCCF